MIALSFSCAAKGYLRKGASLMAMKDYSRASDAYQKALEIDSNCQEALEGYKRYSEAVLLKS